MAECFHLVEEALTIELICEHIASYAHQRQL